MRTQELRDKLAAMEAELRDREHAEAKAEDDYFNHRMACSRAADWRRRAALQRAGLDAAVRLQRRRQEVQRTRLRAIPGERTDAKLRLAVALAQLLELDHREARAINELVDLDSDDLMGA